MAFWSCRCKTLAFEVGHVQNAKFWCDSLRLFFSLSLLSFSFALLASFLPFCWAFSWHFSGNRFWKSFYDLRIRWKERICKGIFWSMLHWWFFAFYSGRLDWIVLILNGLKALFTLPNFWQSFHWPLKLMALQAVEGTWICTGSSGANGLLKV